MSNVILRWFRHYLNEFISTLKLLKINFRTKNFPTFDNAVGGKGVFLRSVVFFSSEAWARLNSSLTAVQFLQVFPDIKEKASSLKEKLECFLKGHADLVESIKSAPELESKIRDLYREVLVNHGRTLEARTIEEKSFHQVAGLYSELTSNEQLNAIGEHPIEFVENIASMTSYRLLNLKSHFDSPYGVLYGFAGDHILGCFSSSVSDFNAQVRNLTDLMNEIAGDAEILCDESVGLRHALALQHNTTYE